MSQPKSNETIAEAIIQNHMLPDVADSSCLYFEPDRDEIKQDILEALAQKDAEVAEEVSEWATHNAKTIHHNNGHREYVDVRDLLDFLSTPKE